MTLKPPRLGETIVGSSGLLLALSLALPWYAGGAGAVSAWKALAVLDVVLAACVVLALLVLGLETTQRTPALTVAVESIAGLIAIVATVWTLVAVALPPVAGATPRFAWLGLAAIAAIAIGCLISVRDEGTDFLPGVEEPDAGRE
jgi:hypothetical protein